MKIRVLLIGKDGQLGQAFLSYFKINNLYDIHAIGHDDLDITDRKKLLLLRKDNYSVIINCSAYNNVDKAENKPNDALKINYFGVRNLSELAKINNTKFIHFSTDYVFDGKQANPYCIYDKTNPLSIYGKSKLFGELAIRETNNNYLIIRTSWVFGGGTNFINQLLKWSTKNKKIEIIRDQISSPTYTFDLVEATIKLLQKDAQGTFHVTNTPVNKLDWAKFILKKIKWKGKIIEVNMDSINFKAERPKYAVLDNSLFNYIVNWKMPSWEDATIRFLQSET